MSISFVNKENADRNAKKWEEWAKKDREKRLRFKAKEIDFGKYTCPKCHTDVSLITDEYNESKDLRNVFSIWTCDECGAKYHLRHELVSVEEIKE